MYYQNDFRMVAQAIDYYKRLGYEYIEVPWLVDKEVADFTIPKGKNPNCIQDDGRCFIGSAEQGFLHLYNQGKIEIGKLYVSFSPCVRIGDVDKYHQEQFYKIELSAIVDNPISCNDYVDKMLTNAKNLFENTLKTSNLQEMKTNENNIDLMLNDIELGSYGYRVLPDGNFLLYGTGLAIPRVNMAFENLGIGYHTIPIIKGEIGSFSKIEEELIELYDAENQDDKILKICELSDLSGAISLYANTLNVSIDDIMKFSNKTMQAFKNKKR